MVIDPYGVIDFSVARLIGRVLEDLKRDNNPGVTVITEPWFCGIGRPTILTRILPFVLVLMWSHSVSTAPSTWSQVPAKK